MPFRHFDSFAPPARGTSSEEWLRGAIAFAGALHQGFRGGAWRRHRFGGFIGEVVFVKNVELGGPVVRVLRLFELFGVVLEDSLLDQLTASRVDRVSDIGMKLGASSSFIRALPRKLEAAVVTVNGPVMILPAATRAPLGKLSAGHCNEGAFSPFNHL